MNSQINFLKQIIVIMMGLSLTSAVQTFFSKYYIEKNINFQNYLIFFLLLLNIIRFFYGNWMYLDKEVSASSVSIIRKKFLLIYIVVISQSIIFSIQSLLKYEYFFNTFVLILIFDILGFIFPDESQANSKRSSQPQTYQSSILEKRWILNNLFSVIFILLAIIVLKSPEQRFYFCFTISSINTIFGFIFSWRYYYPT